MAGLFKNRKMHCSLAFYFYISVNPLEHGTFYRHFNDLKGTVSRDFLLLVFFMNQFPQPQSIPFRPFRIFSKIRGDIRESRCTTGVNDTGGKFATGVNDAGGKLPPVSTTPAANLPPVSLTPVANNGNNIRLQTP